MGEGEWEMEKKVQGGKMAEGWACKGNEKETEAKENRLGL